LNLCWLFRVCFDKPSRWFREGFIYKKPGGSVFIENMTRQDVILPGQ
jgi:hypothetical protein